MISLIKKTGFIVAAVFLTGCVSVSTYKRDMASLNESIETQNKNNQAVVDALKTHKRSIQSVESEVEKVDFWDIRGRLNRSEKNVQVLMEFKADHDKRWVPPVKLKGGK